MKGADFTCLFKSGLFFEIDKDSFTKGLNIFDLYVKSFLGTAIKVPVGTKTLFKKVLTHWSIKVTG